MRSARAGFLLGCLLGWSIGPAYAQVTGEAKAAAIINPDVNAKTVWFVGGGADIYVGAPPEGASDAMKAYAEVLPDNFAADTGQFFKSASITLGYVFEDQYSLALSFGKTGQRTIHAYADVKGTPTDPSDDPLIENALFTYSIISFYYLPKRPFFLGTGLLQGTLNLDQVDPGGRAHRVRVPIDETVVYAGVNLPLYLFWGGGPTKVSRISTEGSPNRTPYLVESDEGVPKAAILNLTVMVPFQRRTFLERVVLVGIGYAF